MQNSTAIVIFAGGCSYSIVYEKADTQGRRDHETVLGERRDVCERHAGDTPRSETAHQHIITEEEYRGQSLSGLIKNWFGNSYKSAVSTLLKDEKITVNDLKELIAEVEKAKDKK